MSNWINIDLSSSNSDDQTNNDDHTTCNWANDENDLPDDWMNAPDPEEVSKKKKEEEERIRKEKEEALEAEKKRKQKIREEKKKRKKLLFDNDDETNNFDDNIFEVTKQQMEISYFHNALDAFGDLNMNINDIDKIDIGMYIPQTAAQYNDFTAAIIKKMNQIFPEIKQAHQTKKEYEQLKSDQDNNKVKMIECLISALCDNYQSAFLADLNKFIIDLYNKKLDEIKKFQGYKKKSKQNISIYFNDIKENDNFDEN